MRDPYTVLGVPKNASEADLKKAFRKLAKAHHPDQNQNDPKAQQRFAELNAAYEIVGDKDKRGQFDRGEIDAEGKPRFQGFDPRAAGGQGGGRGREGFSFGFGQEGPFARAGGDPGDIFSDLFGGRRRGPAKGEDIEAELSLSLEDLVAGGAKRLSLPTGRAVEVAIPKGAGDGKTIRLKGQGHPAPAGGPPGDLLLTIRLRPHPRFRVEGADLRATQPIPLADAVLGGPVRVETLDGAVELTIPPMTSSGRNFRLRGKGLPAGDGRGDLYVTTAIALPDEGDPDLESLMKTRRAAAGAD